MDETDVRILRELGFTPFQQGARGPEVLKPSYVAARLGLSPELVKDRITKMEGHGVIQGYEAFPNLRHLGMAQTTVHYNIDGRAKARAVERLRNVEGISGVFEFVGPGVCVDIYYQSPAELQRRLRLISSLAEVPEPYRLFDSPVPPVNGSLSALDWRILHALRADARRSPAELAAELGVSAKTIHRRIERMVAGGAMDVLPRIDAGQFPDLIPLSLACYFDVAQAPPAVTVGAITKHLGQQAFYAWVPPSAEMGNYDVFAWVRKPREIEQMRKALAALPGVDRVDALLPCNVVFTNDWLTEAIQRMSKNGAADP